MTAACLTGSSTSPDMMTCSSTRGIIIMTGHDMINRHLQQHGAEPDNLVDLCELLLCLISV